MPPLFIASVPPISPEPELRLTAPVVNGMVPPRVRKIPAEPKPELPTPVPPLATPSVPALILAAV